MYAVEAPSTITPARGGLLQYANVIDNAPAHVFRDAADESGIEYQESILAGKNLPVPPAEEEKVFDQVGLNEGQRFAVYRGIEYSLFQREKSGPTLKAAFEAAESHGIERGVQDLLFDGAVDLTPVAGTPVTNTRVALGILEQHAADVYGGLPLIHASRYGTSILSEFLDSKENYTLLSKQGTPVANGGGYQEVGPAGAAAPAGAAWVYVTGQVHVWRSDLNEVDAPALKQNRHLALVERTYVAAVDSFVAAILVGT